MSDSPAADRYEIRSKIGQGGIGAVYQAYDRSLRRDVAIKRLLPQGDKPEEERHTAEEIVREASLLSKLQHPNIVTVYDAGIDDDGGYVVMELIDGETIDKTIERGAVSYEEFLLLAEQALEGLIAAQEIGMLHRDIKPSNVMVRTLPSGKFQLKLLDFGLAKVTQKPALQTVLHGDAILGSIHFMAPEQFEREALDGRTDLYSLGCLFYFALAGRYPFDGENGAQVMAKKLEHEVVPLAQRCPEVPPAIADWVMRMMARHATHRPDSARAALTEFGAAMEAAASPHETTAPNPLLTPTPISTALPVARTTAAPVARVVTAATALPAAPGPVETTTAYFTNPPGTKKSSSGARVAAVIAALTVAAGGGFLLLGGKDQPKDAQGDSATPLEEPAPPADARPPSSLPNTPPPTPPAQSGALVKRGALWLYWDRGLTPGVGWLGMDHPTEDWGQGPAPLGYGDNPKTTIGFGGDPEDKFLSYFFRKRFNYSGESIAKLTLRFQMDDGGIVYLNGDEVARLRMGNEQWPPLDSPSSDMASQGAPEEKWHDFEISTATLKRGENIIAVRVHQENAKSSDLRFDLELIGR